MGNRIENIVRLKNASDGEYEKSTFFRYKARYVSKTNSFYAS